MRLPDLRKMSRRPRNERGGQIVEVTCCSLMVALMGCAVFDTIGLQKRFNTLSQNQLFATAIAQTAIDSAKSLPFEDLSGFAGKHKLQLVNDSKDTEAPPVAPRPIWQDRAAAEYAERTKVNDFRARGAEVFEEIEHVNPNLVRISITVRWKENSHPRSLKMSTLVSRYGIHG